MVFEWMVVYFNFKRENKVGFVSLRGWSFNGWLGMIKNFWKWSFRERVGLESESNLCNGGESVFI